MKKKLANESWAVMAAVAILAIGAAALLDIVSDDAFVALVSAVVGSLLTIVSSRKSEAAERRFRLSLTALDERLRVHQQALNYWYKMFGACTAFDPTKTFGAQQKELNEILSEARDWWTKHSLYLEKDARLAFQQLWLLASELQEWKFDQTMPDDAEEAKQIRHEMQSTVQQMEACRQAIIRGVELPVIKELD